MERFVRSIDALYRVAAPAIQDPELVHRVHTCRRMMRIAWLGLVVGCAQPAVETESRQEIDNPPGCYDTWGCSLSYLGTYTTSLQQQLGCSRSYSYISGASSYFGGIGSFCPDTLTVRRLLDSHGYRGYDATFCNTCLAVPAGELFVFWYDTTGPGCPSSCAPGVPAPASF